MPKPRKYELIPCAHFGWRLTRRGKTYYADGRSNQYDVGRHSLTTTDRQVALRKLTELDEEQAIAFGFDSMPESKRSRNKILTLAEGRRLYEQKISLPRVAGGV